ncbi:hypothetical protein [Streptomyces cadmiisoli]|uniref:hypothetical protein n=1 Tax=Streptomyces cadmiisoli TaxID=2184053 RepID=UPI0036652CB6
MTEIGMTQTGLCHRSPCFSSWCRFPRRICVTVQRDVDEDQEHDLDRPRFTAWLTEVSAVVLQQSLRELDAAYKKLLRRGQRRQDRTVGPPRYKSKNDTRQSIRLNTNAFSLQGDGTVHVPRQATSRSVPIVHQTRRTTKPQIDDMGLR